jgi:ketosteroid isomerase-like protein
VLAADRAFFDALLASDARALEELLTRDFLIVDVAAGSVTDRTAFTEGVAARSLRFEAIETDPSDALVRFYGEVAVVIGRTAMRVALPSGETLRMRSRYTHVFRRDANGCWTLASAQGTQIAS